MKKKITFAVVTGFFVVATMLNMNMLQANNAADVLLKNIAVMAQAQDERDSTKVGSWRYNDVLNKWICSGTGNAC